MEHRIKLDPTALFGTFALLGVAGVGAVFGVGIGHASGASATDEVYVESELSEFETNRYGQTIGEYGVGLRGDPSADPELVLAVGEDGTEGYIYTVDAFGAVPATPQEALQNQSAKGGEPTQMRIPLYAADGRTVIGTYLATIGNPEVSKY